MRVQRFNITKSWLILTSLLTPLFFVACAPTSVTTITQLIISNESPSLSPTLSQSEQFDVVDKDGVKIACPRNWLSQSDPNLVYGVSLTDYIRIVVAVLDAQPQTYYEGLVSQGTVIRTLVAGYTAYRNDYTYPYGDYQLISECITVVNDNKACHIMILCDASVLSSFQPVFDYVMNSLKWD